ncbi:MAG TPA: NAD(P)-dependent oxidoreductase [Candidatus Krumholzibacteria bacterium]|nr:NAD(P)-dependent oxidoreductase [Candidatus Krumholzibacteria bacterium]HPD72098.1 NAD(P)-dependent oxidoreductase [Candidatus Krumholzibacteria bacterium]HRY40970.1 NAD(P)-dependent oxidoreductase [Candidatus Krumholzibacteria bacterium]
MAGGLIAVTGATGFLGSHVCEALAASGHAVRAARRATSDLAWLRDQAVDVAVVDLADPASLDALVDGCRGVIHCAGAVMADPATYARVNVAGTRALLEAAARSRSVETFVLISSLAAGGPGSLDAPRGEAAPDAPVSAYGRSKLAAEAQLAAGPWPFRTVALRPPSLYGPRDREFLPLLRAAARGWTARLGARLTGFSLVHGRDAATAAVALLETATARGRYYLDDGPGPAEPAGPGRRWPWGYDWDEVRQALAGLFQRPVRSFRLPVGALRLASRLAGERLRHASPVLNPDRLADLDAVGWVCAATKLREETAWRPAYDLASGLRDTLAFYRRQGWLG